MSYHIMSCLLTGNKFANLTLIKSISVKDSTTCLSSMMQESEPSEKEQKKEKTPSETGSEGFDKDMVSSSVILYLACMLQLLCTIITSFIYLTIRS